MRRLMLFLPLLLTVVSCAVVEVDVPEGFAESPDFRSGGGSEGWNLRKGPGFSAFSPEGMHYRVRVVRNYPRQELAFWSDALKSHLIDEGYGLLYGSDEFDTEDGDGAFYEWVIPYGASAYIYLTAVVVEKRKILIAECGGEYNLYTAHRDELRRSLRSIALKRRLF